MGLGAGIITVILALTLVSGVPAAFADGDPASDVLTSLPAFIPTDASVPPATVARLQAVLTASAKAGFPIRVALINSAGDLGTVTQFWGEKPSRRAGRYASYLEYELSGLYDGQVLVVMPGGIGLHGPNGGPHATTAAEQVPLPRPGSGTDLATTALAAIPILAKAAGHPLPSDIQVPAVTQAHSNNLWAIVTAVIVGLLLIGACWRWSLRARPLRGNGHPHRTART
jgi:hypothetical protein